MWTLIGALVVSIVVLFPYWTFLFQFFTDRGDYYPDVTDDWLGFWLGIILVIFTLTGLGLMIGGTLGNNSNVLFGLVVLIIACIQFFALTTNMSLQDMKREAMEFVIKFNKSQKLKGEK